MPLYTLSMPRLTAEMGHVVRRKRTAVFGSLRKAKTATGLSTGTWQRIEKGQEHEMASLESVAIALWDGDVSKADELLAGRDPDASAPAEPHQLFREIYRDGPGPMSSWPLPLVERLSHYGRWLTEVEKEEIVEQAASIAIPRKEADKRLHKPIVLGRSLQAAHRGPTEEQSGTVDKLPAESGFDPDEES